MAGNFNQTGCTCCTGGGGADPCLECMETTDTINVSYSYTREIVGIVSEYAEEGCVPCTAAEALAGMGGEGGSESSVLEYFVPFYPSDPKCWWIGPGPTGDYSDFTWYLLLSFGSGIPYNWTVAFQPYQSSADNAPAWSGMGCPPSGLLSGAPSQSFTQEFPCGPPECFRIFSVRITISSVIVTS